MNDIQLRRQRPRLPHVMTALAILLGVPAAAQETEFAASVGWYEPDRPEDAFEVAFDVHFGPELFWGIRPQAGLLATSDGSFYGFGGFRMELPFGWERWRVDISSAVGLFEEGDGKDLGGAVEFRSGVDVIRKFRDGHSLGLGFYHISNASIYDLNPGSNTLVLRWVFGRATRSGDP